MEGVKGLLQSKTIWAAIINLAATGLKAAGYELGVEDQAALVDGVLTLVQLGTGFLVIYGRMKATKAIKAK